MAQPWQGATASDAASACLNQGFQLVEDAPDVPDHGFEGVGASVIRPVPSIPDEYVKGAFDLHFHLRCDKGRAYYCARSEHAIGTERFFGLDDDPVTVGMDLPDNRLSRAVRDEHKLSVLIGVLECTQDCQLAELRVKPLLAELVRLEPFHDGQCVSRCAFDLPSPRSAGLWMQILPAHGISGLDVIREDWERGRFRPLGLGDKRNEDMVECRAEVEQQVTGDDRQQGIVGLGDLDPIGVDRCAFIGFELFGCRVAAAFFDRRDAGIEVTEVMLCPLDLSTPGIGHALPSI